jgi:hypothetical protein
VFEPSVTAGSRSGGGVVPRWVLALPPLVPELGGEPSFFGGFIPRRVLPALLFGWVLISEPSSDRATTRMLDS